VLIALAALGAVVVFVAACSGALIWASRSVASSRLGAKYTWQTAPDNASALARVTEDKPPPWKQWRQSKLWGLFSFVSGLVVGAAVGQFERTAVAEAAGQSTIVIMLIGWIFWSVLSRRWLWFFVTVVTAVHVVAVCTAPWPAHREMGDGDIFFGLGDLVLMGGLGAFLARLTRKSDGKS